MGFLLLKMYSYRGMGVWGLRGVMLGDEHVDAMDLCHDLGELVR